jgi:hypothetical protein
MENEGAPAIESKTDAADNDEVLVEYRGSHPLIRRCGVVLTPESPARVSRAVGELLTAAPDCAYAPSPTT